MPKENQKWFSRWWRGGCFSFGQAACAPRGPEAGRGVSTKTEDETLNNAQGLSLSTAPKTTTKKKTSSEKSVGTWIMIITISITISGLILLGVAAAIVYYYRKNWEKWGGDQDEYDEVYKEEN